jgi:carboxyl-terminal processing protease
MNSSSLAVSSKTRRRSCAPRLLLATTAIAITLIAGAIVALGQAQPQITSSEREYAEGMLSNIHRVLKEKYYDPSYHGIDPDGRYKTYREQLRNAKTIGAAYRVIEAYLSGLDDSHTIFVPPPNSKRVRYGFRLKMIGEQCFITDVRPDTDAAQKLHPGDQVVSLDGYALHRQDLWQLEYYLYRLPPRLTSDFTLRDISGGVRHESITAEFEAGNSLLDSTVSSIAHARIENEYRRHMLRSRSAEEGDVLFWRLPSFSGDEGDISTMFAKARKHKALVLDLRGNGGGLESVVVFMLSNLFDHDVTIGKQVMRKEQKQLVVKSRGHDAFAGQLTVLIDSRSASAAEILARVVQLEHRGTVVGDRSAGSVMVAQFYPLKEGVGLVLPYGVEITIADLIMTDGKSLEKHGVIPDVTLLPSASDLADGRDPVLAHAAELAGAKLDTSRAGRMFPYEWPVANPTIN